MSDTLLATGDQAVCKEDEVYVFLEYIVWITLVQNCDMPWWDPRSLYPTLAGNSLIKIDDEERGV